MPIPGVRINGTLYAIQIESDPGAARALVWLRNVTNGEAYNVAHHYGLWECDCGDYEFRKAQTNSNVTGCKHTRAVRSFVERGVITLPTFERKPLFQ